MPRDLENKRAWQRQDRLKHPEKYRARDRKRREANPELFAQRHKAWRMRNPDGPRNNNLKRNFGITAAEYDRMYAAQGGVCKICGCHQRYQRLAVDHNHKTSAIRGLLCVMCNRGIGMFFDSPLRLIRAAEYLRQAKGASNAIKDEKQYVGQDASSDTCS